MGFPSNCPLLSKRLLALAAASGLMLPLTDVVGCTPEVRALPPLEYREHAINKAQAARLMAEENTLRVLRVQRAAVRGGLRIGSLAGLFFAAQISSQYARQTRDILNIVLGGAVAGTAAGLMREEACPSTANLTTLGISGQSSGRGRPTDDRPLPPSLS